MASFRLRLENTYWLNGFFNINVDFQRFVTMTDGPIDIYIGDSSQAVVGRVSRTANQNATPRIYGKKALAEFFQSTFKPGALVQVEIVSPTAIRVGGQ